MSLNRIVLRDVRSLTLKTSKTGRAMSKFMFDLQKALKKELRDQGHVGSGKLLDSININFPNTNSGLFQFKAEIEALSYGLRLNEQQSPKRVREGDILKWMNSHRDFKPTNPKVPREMIAKYIARSISEEGIPTVIVNRPNKLSAYSSRYTNNGRRLGWINIPYERKKINIDKKVIPAISEDVVDVIGDFLDKLASRYPNIKVI